MHSLLNSGADRPSLLLGMVLGVFFLWRYTHCVMLSAWAFARRFSGRRGISRRAQWIALFASLLAAGATVSVLIVIGD